MTFKNDKKYFPRLLQNPLKNNTSFFLFGPRGTGKSTWIKHNVPDVLVINLLETDHYKTLLAEPSRIRQMIKANPSQWVVIDEIQKIPELLNEVHHLIESENIQFILTGSSARKLRQNGVNLLAGRAHTYNMYPLTSIELGSAFNLEISLQYGMLPEIYTNSDPARYLESYLNTYLREEVLQEGLTRNLAAFSSFLEAASFSQGSLLNISEVARECMLERMTVHNYFTILEDLLIATRLPVFSRRSKRKLITQKKFYFFDCGVYQQIRPKGVLDSGAEIGGIALETLVFQELRAVNDYYNKQYQLYFWRTKHGIEVDFVLYGPKGFKAIEVKRSKTLHQKDLKNLNAFLKDYPEAEGYLFFGGKTREQHGKITAIPIEDALKTLPEIL